MSANRQQFRRCQKFQRYCVRRGVNLSENIAGLIWVALYAARFRERIERRVAA